METILPVIICLILLFIAYKFFSPPYKERAKEMIEFARVIGLSYHKNYKKIPLYLFTKKYNLIEGEYIGKKIKIFDEYWPADPNAPLAINTDTTRIFINDILVFPQKNENKILKISEMKKIIDA